MSETRRYDEKAVSEILRRAAELERGGGPGSGGGLSRADIERVATEAGLDPAAVRAAIAERDRVPEPSGGFLGGPLRLRQQRVVEGELDEDAVEEVINLAQHELGMFGRFYRSGRTTTWSPKGVARRLQVRLQSREGGTEIAVDERLGPLAGGLWGGLFGGLAGASIGLSVPLGVAVFGSVGALVAIFGACTAGAYLLTRAIYKSVSTRRGRELSALADRLAEQAATQAEATALGTTSEDDLERTELPHGKPRDSDSNSRRRGRRRSRD